MYRVLHIPTGLWAHAFIVGRKSNHKCALLFSEPTDFTIYPSIDNITIYTIGYASSASFAFDCTSSEFEIIDE